MFDIFDVFAFVVFAVLLSAAIVVVVFLGSLPGWIARKRGHPQAAAVNAAGWLGVATLGVLWPLALIWAFLKPLSAAPPDPDATARLARMQSQMDSLVAAQRELRAKEEVAS